MNDSVEVNEFEFRDVCSDAGKVGIEWMCPDCKTRVLWADSAWWDLECSCRTWTLEMSAIGKKMENDG